jgi:bacteriocin-like protein
MNAFEELTIKELNNALGGMQEKCICDDCLV